MKLKKYKLGDLCTFVNGRAYLQPELQNYGKYKIVRVGNLSGGNNSWYYSDMELEPTKYCAKGDLLYAWACNFGPYIWKGDKTIYHYHIWKVINSEQIDKMYLYYLLKFMTNSFMGCVHGSTMLHITKENMESMEVRIHASIEEQRRIATILNKLDCKIELNRQINDNLEAMAKQLYDYWFVQFDFPNEEGKPYKSSGGAMVYNERLKREIPVGWQVENLVDFAEIKNGATPSTSDDTNYGGDIVWITPKDLSDQQSKFVYRGERNITKQGFDSCSTSMLPINSLLMSSRAPIGLISIAKHEVCTNQGFKSFIPKNMKDSIYLYYYIKHHIKQIEQLGTGTTFKEVSRDDLCKFPILVVGANDTYKLWVELQDEIANKQFVLTKEIASLTKQRDELLPLLMNGQASVNYHLSAC